MSDPDASTRIITDVFPGDPGDEWRLTGLHPKFQLQIQRVSPLNFYMRFENSESEPVSFTITIDGHSFQSPRFSTGSQEYRRPLPDGWLAKPGPVDITVEIAAPHGILLHSIGFEER